ncbi:MAG TPA: ACP S-malonyltransferase [Nitrospiraceae bacterium]|jgi:[acyl-carrier-protein] S-malonyltransferase|nr:ACP S-malonyltransferase [Nitrospiraceae bacterium]
MASGIGLVFPGQGSQSVGMGRALYEAFPAVRTIYEEASSVLGYDVAALCFEGPADRLNLTEYTQPALLTSSIAALRLLEQAGVKPLAVAGHSLGEYSAVVAAGGLAFRDAVLLVQKRGRYMAEAVPSGSGLVAAILGLTGEIVREICREVSSVGVVAAANFNCPGQVVIAGEKTAVERAIELAKTKGSRRAVPLPVSVPVHTPLMQPAADRLARDVTRATWSDLTVPLVNNADAKPIRQASEVQASLVRQLPSSVLWEDSIKTMAGLGVTTFVEVGPGTVLTGLIKRILPNAMTLNVNDPKSLDATLTALHVKRDA